MKKELVFRKKTAIPAVFFLSVLLILSVHFFRPQPLPLGGNDSFRREYLGSFGLETGDYTAKTVAVPAFPEEYLAFQHAQGLYPEEYVNKNAVLYCFQVINLSNFGAEIYANLLICEDFVIAGEVFSKNDPEKISNLALNSEIQLF